MSRRKKSKRKKHQQPPAEKNQIRQHKMPDNQNHVHVDGGRIEADFPPKLKEDYSAGQAKQDRREYKKFVVEIITAILLFCYTTIAFWQGCSARDSADAAIKAANGAAESERLDKRAWISTQSMSIKITDYKTPIAAQAVIINSGKTFAFNARVDYSLLFSHDEKNISEWAIRPSRPEPSTIASVGTIPPNLPRILFVFPSESELSQFSSHDTKQGRDLLLSSLKEKKMFIYLFGRISYEDIFHVSHYTNFCGEYNPDTGAGFDACPTYNDAD
jgi:hypothetical protein